MKSAIVVLTNILTTAKVEFIELRQIVQLCKNCRVYVVGGRDDTERFVRAVLQHAATEE